MTWNVALCYENKGEITLVFDAHCEVPPLLCISSVNHTAGLGVRVTYFDMVDDHWRDYNPY